ncbi:MAG: TSCPD domain-containing protein, partial [Actinobacteria bacterium]|nr:TSCPD domain-containing protein [Actinomycetota bacterium]
LPNSPTLMNAGKELQQLAACFVLPVGDSMSDIFEALKETALIQKSGGGVGYSFSRIRPRNDVVLSTKGVSSGPISFMTVFNAATDTIKQGGTRRGANMGILRVDHPDILDFIVAKVNSEKLTNFNLSVGVTETFMRAVENDETYEIINPRTKEVVDKYNAREIFNKIVQHAWKNGDPGIVFLDRLNKDNPTPNLGQIESTNPCVTGDTLISTSKGWIRAEELHQRIKDHEDIRIVFDKRALEYKASKEIGRESLGIYESGELSSWHRGEKEVYRLITSSGYELEATADHKILTTGGYKELGKLKEEDEVLIQPLGKFTYAPKIKNYNKFIDRVKKIEHTGRKVVYDFNEPISNSFIANGITVRNCGEQPLLPYEACNLGSINLANMVMEEGGVKMVDYGKLKKVVHTSVRFLDDVIDMSKYPLEKITRMVDGNRKIGLGIMGWADMLVILGIPYDSEEALELAGKVMGFIQEESKDASRALARERGVFPNFEGSIYDSPDGYQIRNATTTTIAPTGTLSIIADCSSGIEPLFAISFVKNVMDNDKLLEVNKYFRQVAMEEGFFSEGLMERIAECGSLEGVEEIPSQHRRIFITAHEVSPKWHVRMQAAFQKFVDNAVSKTVNFSNSATVKDVEDVYMLSYRLGCKGITIYRDGSRDAQVLEVKGKKQEDGPGAEEAMEGKGSNEITFKQTMEKKGKSGEEEIKTLKPRPRPEITRGMTRKYKIGSCGKLYVTVNSDEQGVCEVFTNTGEEGCAALTEAVGRLLSISIRAGIDINEIKKQVEGIRCITCIADPETHVLSCPDAIAKTLEFYLKGSNKFDFDVTSGPKSVMICPEEGCGGIMEPEGGCYVCRNCGYSRCS